MKKINKYIEVIRSSDPRLSAMNEGTQQAILAVLSKRYAKVGISIIDTMDELVALTAKSPDLVVLGTRFILLDAAKGYERSPKLWISGHFIEHGIAFTGSATGALMLEFNKHEAKQKVIDSGLRSSAYFMAKIGRPIPRHELTFPLFVKPTDLAGSEGVDEKSVVYSQIELEARVAAVHNIYGSDALVEQYLPGREFSVAVFKQHGSVAMRAMPIEILAPADAKGNRFLSEAVKHADSEKVISLTDIALRDTIGALALGVFGVIGARDYGRIDIRLDASGQPNFIEANLMPGLSDHGYLYRCLRLNSGMTYDDMIMSIVELGLRRNEKPLLSPVATTIPLLAGTRTW